MSKEKREGEVTEVRYREPKGNKPAVIFIDDDKYSFFKEAPVDLKDIKAGDKVAYTFEKNNGYNNLTSIGIVEKGSINQDKSGSSGKAMRIGAAAKCGSRIEAGTENPTVKGAIEKADGILEWMEKKVG